jgi:hypothetical protein
MTAARQTQTSPAPTLARSPKEQAMDTTITAASTTSGSAGGSRRRPLARRAASVLTVLTAAAATAALSLTAAPALADECPNEALRAENNSTQLPECRAYELVTPQFKEGFLPFNAIGGDGRLAFSSSGNFANNGLGHALGNLYVANRSPSGWSTTAQAPSGPEYDMGTPANILSSDLSSSLWIMSRADQPIAVGDLYLRGSDGLFTRIGPATDPALVAPTAPGGTAYPAGVNSAVSNDLSHVVIESDFSAAAGGPANDLYEYIGTGHERPQPVSVDNTGKAISSCGAFLSGYPSSPSSYHVISADGRVIFFTSGCGTPALYARVNATTTISVAASQCTRTASDPGGACDAESAPTFQGANADGTRVYFTTEQQLVNGDTDATTDLYECDIPAGTPTPEGLTNPCPDLREVSGAAGGAAVQGVTRISEDGSRVYFVATGVLASNLGANAAAAVAGDDNLYVWQRNAAHPSGTTTFVGTLGPGDGQLWDADIRPAQTTDDGRYLVFMSGAALIDSGPQADTDTAQDIYRYDADTGTLVRLSTDTDGTGGNAPGRDAQFLGNPYLVARATPGPRGAMTDDGTAAVFTTTEALSPADTNGTYDVYLWRDGRVSLISSGQPSLDGILSFGSLSASISPSGRDIYFGTTAQLIANDVDTEVDIYDARIDGGFDPSSPPGCVGDSCQSARSTPPSPTQPGSSSSTGLEVPPQARPTFSVQTVTAAQRRRAASTGKVTLSITTNAPGTLSATATIAKRPGTVGTAKRNVPKASAVSLALTLSKKARAQLRNTGKLTVTILVRQDNGAVPRTVSLKLTRTKTARKAKTSRHAVVKGGRS